VVAKILLVVIEGGFTAGVTILKYCIGEYYYLLQYSSIISPIISVEKG
jgi:hypothetical protein